MPVLEVSKAETSIVMKRSMATVVLAGMRLANAAHPTRSGVCNGGV